MDFSKLPGVKYCRFKKGHYIVKQGEIPEHVYSIVSGRLKRVITNDKGDEMIMERFGRGDLVCVIMVYANAPGASNIIVERECYCYQIPKAVFLNEMNHNIDLMKKVLNKLIKMHLELRRLYRYRQEGHTPNYLCAFLLKHAKKEKEGRLILDKSITNAEIGRLLGVHRVTAARIINRLQKDGVISRTAEGLELLDTEELTLYAKNQKSLTY
ncbi:MAG: Crp/Fnr family transcriptional regulator [Peptococcales bacterium]|jgi:CRP/FNR family cyclic AMP-dependent transcriptional regulator